MPKCARLALALCFAFATTAAAEPPPATSTLTTAKALKRKNPRYPMTAMYGWKEGWVHVSYCIGVDGAVADPVIEESSGIKEFEREVLRVMPGWKYTPALRDGVPVEQCEASVLMTFSIAGGVLGARSAFVREWKALYAKIEAGDLDGASAALDVLRPENNYENARIAMARSRIAEERGDREAQLDAVHAALRFPQHIEKKLASKMRRLRFGLELTTHEFAAALASFKELEERDANVLNDAERKAGDQLRTLIASEGAIATPGKLERRCHQDNGSPLWTVGMLRREFSFSEATGSLERFELRCKGKRFSSPFSLESAWKIPESWGDCTLFVFGDEGATLKLVEYAGEPAASAPTP